MSTASFTNTSVSFLGKNNIGSGQFQITKPAQHLDEECKPKYFYEELYSAGQSKSHQTTEQLIIKCLFIPRAETCPIGGTKDEQN